MLYVNETNLPLNTQEMLALKFLLNVTNDDTYHTWASVGLLTHALTDGSHHGRILFDGWSSQSPKYLAEQNAHWSDPWWRSQHAANLAYEARRPAVNPELAFLAQWDHSTATRH